MTTRPTATDTDALVRAAQAGDVTAFEALYRAHGGRVFAICVRLSGDRSRAEDLTQEAFIRAWQKLDTFQAGTNFPAWLATVAVNVSLSERRSRSRRASHETAVEHLPEPARAREACRLFPRSSWRYLFRRRRLPRPTRPCRSQCWRRCGT